MDRIGRVELREARRSRHLEFEVEVEVEVDVVVVVVVAVGSRSGLKPCR